MKSIDSELIIRDLKQDGFRITKVRRALISALASAPQPQSAIELLEALEQYGLAVNKTTVYRELDFLLEQKIVAEIDLLDGMKRYELVVAEHHHHHLVCLKCKKIQCVEMDNDLDELEKRIKKRHQFKVESHILEFFGLCAACQ